jgi:hypothetical protein
MTIERGSVDLQSKGEKIKFVFSADGEKLGELYISAASVEFKAKNKQKLKKWSITQFVKLLEENS